MRKVVLLCSAGLSTSALVTKIKEAAALANYELDINAFPISETDTVTKGADLVLLGPQIRFQMNTVKKECDCPVEAINMRAYGMMDGAAVVKEIKRILGD